MYVVCGREKYRIFLVGLLFSIEYIVDRTFRKNGKFPVIFMGVKHREIEGVDVIFKMNFVNMVDGILINVNSEI